MLHRKSFMAILGEQVAGFSDVSQDDYIDMLYVSPGFARRGVARALSRGHPGPVRLPDPEVHTASDLGRCSMDLTKDSDVWLLV